MESPQTHPLSLFDAMCAWGDPDKVAEMLALKRRGADAPILVLGRRGPEPAGWRYRDIREGLEDALVARLLTGGLIAEGYDSDGSFDQPMIRIPSDRWRVLTPDFDESSAVSHNRKIIGIVVSPREKVDAGPSGEPSAIPLGSGLVRLVIRQQSKSITLDGKPITLAARPFSLFLLLAEAAQAGTGPMRGSRIKDTLWSPGVSERAATDVVRDLRSKLRSVCGSGFDPHQFIQSRTGLGYVLDLRVRPETSH